MDINNKIANFSQSCTLYSGEKAHMETQEVVSPFYLAALGLNWSRQHSD